MISFCGIGGSGRRVCPRRSDHNEESRAAAKQNLPMVDDYPFPAKLLQLIPEELEKLIKEHYSIENP